jgi:hypothetical protein
MRRLVTGLLVIVGLVGVGAVAAPLSTAAAAAPRIVGTWPNTSESPAGGWILWSNGTVRPVGEAPFYGDARRSGLNDFVGMITADDAGGAGYFLVTSTGKVRSFGPVCGTGGTLAPPAHLPTSGVVGLIDRSDGYAGFEMVTSSGAMFGFSCD